MPIKFDTDIIEKKEILENEFLTYSPTITEPQPYELENNYQNISINCNKKKNSDETVNNFFKNNEFNIKKKHNTFQNDFP